MAYAIVETGGLQFRVQDREVLEVPRLQVAEGETVTLDRVLMWVDEADVVVGQPTVEGASVQARVLGQILGPKIIVFKQKRRKNYRRKRGHRQHLTKLEITGLTRSV
ncbi:MAG: 50S ribosomal protein L21 [Candidatus Eisenbacteria sp.]|nr:50S ribosomal protein L21 [Candidatus Eisenbacteria bacterium]